MARPFMIASYVAISLFTLSSGALAGAGFPSSIDLSNLDGTNGFTLLGAAGDGTGWTVSDAGDVNGDGVDDITIGARFADPGGRSNAGRAYVVFGSPSGFPSSFDLSTLDGTNGFAMNGISNGSITGDSVSGAGDMNGDGIDDVAILARLAGSFVTEAYVVFGSDSGFPPAIELSSLDGTNGFRVTGVDVGQATGGIEINGSGDLNDDGLGDIVIGMAQGAAGGLCYVILGDDSGFAASLDVSSLDGTNGFVLNAVGSNDGCGWSANAAGDVNGDGIDDLTIGAPTADPNGPNSGEAYVVFGNALGFPASFNLSGLDGTNGFVLRGVSAGDNCGRSVSGVGDMNGDGIDDLAVGADTAGAGRVYVVFGSLAGFPASLELSSLDGTSGFSVVGRNSGDLFGESVSGAGDVNGDGLGDLLAGAPDATPAGGANAGESYVIFGSSMGFPASFNVSLLDGDNGFALIGVDPSDNAGGSVSSAGDVDGDGTSDLMVGAVGASSGGETYILYGRVASCSLGSVNAANGIVLDTIFVNGSAGGEDRTVELQHGEFVDVLVLQPIAGGNGRFVLHANEGDLDAGSTTILPFNVGTTCFPFLLGDGATPVIIANSIGKTGAVGSTNFYGLPLDDPERATTTVTYPPLPLGTVLTLQGVIVDPGSLSPRSASTTNAIVVRVTD